MSTYQAAVFILLCLIVVVGIFCVLLLVRPRPRQWPWPTEEPGGVPQEGPGRSAEPGRPARDPAPPMRRTG